MHEKRRSGGQMDQLERGKLDRNGFDPDRTLLRTDLTTRQGRLGRVGIGNRRVAEPRIGELSFQLVL